MSYNGESIEYNSIGNPTVYRGKTAEWQYGVRLIKLGGTTFAYDGLGRRIKKGEIGFTYDNDGRLIKQSNGLEFVYDNSGVAGVICGGEQYFYRKDAQGNITAILDNTGSVVVRYIYDCWGNHAVVDADGGDITTGIGVLNPFRYRGYYYDTETGLYYLQTRYYDPELGRFISQDNIDYADPKTINGLNLYAYCGDNPVMNIDNDGTVFLSFLLGLVIAAAIGVAVGATAGGILAAVNGENVWTGIWKGALIGGFMGLSVGLVVSGLGAPLAGTIWGSVAVAAGIGSGVALGVNTFSQLNNGSIASLNVGQTLKSWGIGLGIGALAGGLSFATTAIGSYYGGLLGLTLSSKTFLGVTISKVLSSSVLTFVGSSVGGGIGGLLGGSFINYIATDSNLQEQNVPLWFATFLKQLFKK